MKKIFSIIVLFLAIAACSSSKKVDHMAESYEPILEPDAQIARVVEKIQNDKNLDDSKKNQLIDLVNEQYKKTVKLRERQSQLRALLVDQLLEGAGGKNPSTISTTKELEDLNKKNIKGLNDFILKFQAISGERERRHTDYMREVGNVHLI